MTAMTSAVDPAASDEGEFDLDLIYLPPSPWSMKARWILHHCSIEIRHRLKFEPFIGELWLRYQVGLWPWHSQYWTRLTLPIAILHYRSPKPAAVKRRIMFDSFEIAEWALRTTASTSSASSFSNKRLDACSQATIQQLKHWNELSDDILRFGRAQLIEASFKDTDIAVQAFAPKWLRKFPATLLVKPIVTLGLWVFAFKYRVEIRDASAKADALEAVKQVREALQNGEGRYLLNDTFSYADMLIAIAVNMLSPSDSSRRKALVRNSKVLHGFDDVVAWKNAIFEQHLPSGMRTTRPFALK